jgi:hypothetical protein
MTERKVEYRECPGHAGYRAGSDGTIWSINNCDGEWRIKPASPDKDGYLRVTLHKRTVRKVAHLVLEAFVGPRPAGMQACHFPDRSLANNRVENLRWDTQESNSADKRIHGTDPSGERSPNHKITTEQALEILARRSNGETCKSIANDLPICRSTVSKIATGRLWKHLSCQLERKNQQAEARSA